MKLKIIIAMFMLAGINSVYAQQVYSTSLSNQGNTGLAAQIEERNRVILRANNPDMLNETVNEIDRFEQNFVYQQQNQTQLRSNVLKEQLARIQSELQKIDNQARSSTFRYKSDTPEEYKARLISSNQRVQQKYILLKQEEQKLIQEISRAETLESRTGDNIVYDERTERIRQRMEFINSQRNQ